MINRIAVWLAAAGNALLLAGCIHHEETVYRDVARTSVEFENDKAARIFYEALNNSSSNKDRTESKTEVQLPLVFHDERRVVSGPNGAFNRAVDACDTNRDGRITEQEAQIFSDNRRR
jgi:hypothetical protein